MSTTLARTFMVGLVLALAGSTAAVAGPVLEKEHFHDVWSEVEEDFCDELTVRIDGDLRGNILFVRHGADGLAYWSISVHGTIRWTNVDNGLSVLSRFAVRDMDHDVVDNGDGTLTITVLVTGGQQFWGPDGRLLFNDPGQIRYQVLIDHGGTPDDPSDDEFLEDLGIVKGSTGRNDTVDRDFCEDMVALIG